MKKVVVVYPHHHFKPYMADITSIGARYGQMVEVDSKNFEGKSLEVVNTDAGNLIIKEANGATLAVFKHWIYWENIE